MNKQHSQPFDTADYLKTTEQIIEYLNAALEDGNEQLLLAAIMDVVKATGGVMELSRRTGLSREAIYRSLSEEGNPRFSSLIAILHALGLEVCIVSCRDRIVA